jgi:heme-degrading monooxygenase HmoA
MESVRENNGFGITVCYWKDEESITNWKNNLEHRRAKEKGIADWYKKYFLRVAKVERDNETI